MANITGTLVPDLIIPGGNIQGELLPDLSGDDIIDSRDGDDAVAADAGNDSVVGGLGDDQLFGNAGNDTMRGDAGLDSLYGGRDDDLLYGDDGNDLVFADLGNDTGYGGAGDDLMTGNKGEDALYGGDGNDSIFGGQDNDSIFGDAGDDLLLGDLGADTLEGGAGNDIFVMSRRDATLTTGGATVDDADLIKDFVKGEDKFMLDGLQFTDLNIQVDADGNSTIQDSQTSQFLAKVEGVSDLDVTDFTGVTTDPGPQGAFQFSQAAYTGVEGTDAANPGKTLITVTRTDGSQDPVSVGYKVTPGVTNPALAGGIDFFETTDGLLTFAAGETQKTFEVLLPADPGTTNVADDGKTVSLTLFNPTNGAVLGSQSAAVLTIGDSAGSGVAVVGAEYEFVLDSVAGASTNVYGVAESDGGTALGTFTTPITIKRSITVGEDTINFNAFDATATSPDDFTRVTGQTVTFADGQQFATVDVVINNDGTAVAEPDIENASLTLQNGSGQVLDSANLLINNQAGAATGAGFSFGTSTYSLGSGGVAAIGGGTGNGPNGEFLELTVFRSNVSTAETVDYSVIASTTGSAATADPDGAAPVGSTSDFVPVSGQLSFGIGELTKTIQVPAFFDGGSNEFITAELTGNGLGLFPTASVDIL
ncbi:Calx-beta domain-containing protein [Baaleninema simplex]|uniref:Calx-beta domain-containing protein n=1 Tax=Baaleninema simplex TaxID=2862350 RepID=UPI00034500BD|nr:Calx-beta domain-containing protein [Baaleninema simplex]